MEPLGTLFAIMVQWNIFLYLKRVSAIGDRPILSLVAHGLWEEG